MAQGFVLTIDNRMLERLETADKLIEDLATKSEQTQERVIAAFTAMADQGVGAFIGKLQEVNAKVSEMGEMPMRITGLSTIEGQVERTVNSIMTLIDAMKQLRSVMSSSNDGGSTERVVTANEAAKQTMRELNKESRKMERTYTKLTEAVDRYKQSANDLVKKIEDTREAQRKFNEEAKKAAQTSATSLTSRGSSATTLNELKNYANELKQTMANLDPKSEEWEKLNEIFKNTTHRISEISGAMRNTHGQSSRLLDISSQLARKIALVFSVSQVTGYLNRLMQVRGEMELQQRSLQAILQNKEKANEIWDKTIALAVKSPFEIKELVTYTKQLAAYRVESSKLYDTTKMLADISAGLGVDMQRLILAYGQVKAANYLRGTELRQFSEAGINILGELSTYFSELEGTAVSVGEVFERVSKRMVTFEDVAKIFERMTAAGGTFYNMQEIQSRTLLGQIRNLKDSVNIMLNEIGTSTEGILKGAISSIREIVEGWRSVAGILTTIAELLAAQGIYKIVTTLRLTGDALARVAIEGKGVASIVAKIKKLLTTGLSSGGGTPWGLIVAGILSAVNALWSYAKSMQAINEKYDEMGSSTVATIDNLEDYEHQIEKNNSVIKEGKENTEEYNEAVRNNQSIIAKLNADYPELASKIKEYANGQLDAKNAIEQHTMALQAQLAIQQLAKASLGNQSLGQRYATLLTAQSGLDDALAILKADLITYRVKMGEQLTEAQVDILQQLGKASTIRDIYTIKNTSGTIFDGKVWDKWLETPNKKVSKLQETITSFQVELNQYIPYLRLLMKSFDMSSDQGILDFSEQVKLILQNLGIVDEKALELARKFYSFGGGGALGGFQLDFSIKSGNESFGLADWQIRYNEFIDSLKSSTLKKKTTPTTIEDETKALKEQIDAQKTIIASYEGGAKVYSTEEYQKAKVALLDLTRAYEWLNGALDEANKKERAQATFNEQVRVLKELAEQYKKAGKTLDSFAAKETAVKKVGDAFQKAFGKSIEEMGIDFTSEEGLLAAFDDLIKNAPEAVNTFQAALAKADIKMEGVISQVKLEDQQVIDSFQNELNSYKLSLELEKLGVPKDFAKSLVNFSGKDLSIIREGITSRISELTTLGGKTELIKELEELLKEIDMLEAKAQFERLKKYSTYLAKTQSKRVAIELDTQRQISEVHKLGVGDTEKELMISAIRKNAQKEIDKIQWEDFKNSSFYQLMWEDLSSLGDKTLKVLVDQLHELKGSLDGLDPTQMKEIVKAIEKAEKELSKRSPIMGMVDALQTLQDLKAKGISEDSLVSDLADIEEKTRSTQAVIDELTIKLANMGVNAPGRTAIEGMLNTFNKILEDLGLKADEIQQRLELWKKSVTQVGSGLQAVNKWSNVIADEANEIRGLLESCGLASKDWVDTTFDVVGLLGDAITESVALTEQLIAMGVASDAAAGPIGWIVLALKLAVSLAKYVIDSGQQVMKDQIDAWADSVENLSDKYQELKEVMDSASSFDQLRASTEEMKRNEEKQAKLIATMRGQAENIKDEDERNKYLQEADDYEQELLSNTEDRIRDTFTQISSGILDDVLSTADAFVDAWYNAFIETGDGLSGLEENFDEMLLNLVKRQAAMSIVGPFVEKMKSELQKYLNEEDFILTMAEADQWAGDIRALMPDLSNNLENIFSSLSGILGDGSGELSGLQKGISGITEEQADILAAYWNSTRGYMAQIDATLTSFVEKWENAEYNPIVKELATQTQLIRSIKSSLESVIYSSGNKTGLKIFLQQ